MCPSTGHTCDSLGASLPPDSLPESFGPFCPNTAVKLTFSVPPDSSTTVHLIVAEITPAVDVNAFTSSAVPYIDAPCQSCLASYSPFRVYLGQTLCYRWLHFSQGVFPFLKSIWRALDYLSHPPNELPSQPCDEWTECPSLHDAHLEDVMCLSLHVSMPLWKELQAKGHHI